MLQIDNDTGNASKFNFYLILALINIIELTTFERTPIPFVAQSVPSLSIRDRTGFSLNAQTGSSLNAQAKPMDVEAIIEMAKAEAGEDTDMAKVEAIIKEVYEAGQTPIGDVVATTPSAFSIAAEAEIQDACTFAVIDVAIEAISLLLAISGAPSKVTKKVAQKIINRNKKKIVKEMKKILKEYFMDSDNLPSIGTGLSEIASLVLSIMSPQAIFNAIIEELSWVEAIGVGALLLAQIALTFGSGGIFLAGKLLLFTGPVIDLVSASVRAVDVC